MKDQLKIIHETYHSNHVIHGKLGKGGQGVTFLLKEKPDFKNLSVLKILNFDRPKTRRRFHVERTALETLMSENLKIPVLLESNSEEYNTEGIPLYIRTSYIEGNTLDEFLTNRGLLSLEEAVNFGIQLFETLISIHDSKLVHRDIKPKNIIVTEDQELYLVDFGLSYDKTHDDSITNAGDTIGNSFYSLPEHRLEGEDKRDERSDISMAIGIIYYLMTGCFPIENYDSKGNKPHERECYLKLELEPTIRLLKLNNLFNLAFENNKQNRVQTSEEAINELIKIMDQNTDKKDLKSIAEKANERLQKNSVDVKSSVIAKKHKDELNKFFVLQMSEVNKELGYFKLERGGGQITRFVFLNRDGQIDGMSFKFGLTHQDYRQAVRAIEYKFCLEGNTCVLYRREGKIFIEALHVQKNRSVENLEEVVVLRFNYEEEFDYEIIKHDLNEILGISIERLTDELEN